MPEQDVVNRPSHYADGWSNGAEVIDITENLNFNRGNAVKYIARAGKKDPEKELEDLKKAEFYLKREIARITPVVEDGPRYIIGWDFEIGQREPAVEEAVTRQWDSLYVVPKHVEVVDNDGDRWKHDKAQGWGFKSSPSGRPFFIEKHGETSKDYDYVGPFVEILEGE